jgi:hypothetical protein
VSASLRGPGASLTLFSRDDLVLFLLFRPDERNRDNACGDDEGQQHGIFDGLSVHLHASGIRGGTIRELPESFSASRKAKNCSTLSQSKARALGVLGQI